MCRLNGSLPRLLLIAFFGGKCIVVTSCLTNVCSFFHHGQVTSKRSLYSGNVLPKVGTYGVWMHEDIKLQWSTFNIIDFTGGLSWCGWREGGRERERERERERQTESDTKVEYWPIPLSTAQHTHTHTHTRAINNHPFPSKEPTIQQFVLPYWPSFASYTLCGTWITHAHAYALCVWHSHARSKLQLAYVKLAASSLSIDHVEVLESTWIFTATWWVSGLDEYFSLRVCCLEIPWIFISCTFSKQLWPTKTGRWLPKSQNDRTCQNN